jgi:hypothetical protein
MAPQPIAAQMSTGLIGRHRAKLISLLFFLGPFVSSIIPRLTWLFLPLTGAAVVLPALRYHCGWRDLLSPSTVWIAFLLLSLYLILNGTWAADQPFAFGTALLFFGVSLTVCASSRAISFLPKTLIQRAAIAFVVGAFVGAVYLVFELLTNASMMRIALNSIDLLQRNAKHMTIAHGEVTKIKNSVLNRNAAIVMFNLWPGLLILKNFKNAIVLSIVFSTLTATAVLMSEHDSSQVALISSPLIFLCAKLWPRVTVRALAVAWCLAFVLIFPTVFMAYKADLHSAPWLPMSARHRVIIWEYTAERVPYHFWGGIGTASTPALKPKPETAEKPPGFLFPRSTGEHAHDMFLQTWYELGLIGVFLVALAGAATATRIYLLPSAAVPFAAATFFVCLVVESFAWSVWQTWLMCAVGLLVIYVRVAAECPADSLVLGFGRQSTRTQQAMQLPT